MTGEMRGGGEGKTEEMGFSNRGEVGVGGWAQTERQQQQKREGVPTTRFLQAALGLFIFFSPAFMKPL